VGDVITDAKFYRNRLRGFGVIGPLKRHFPYRLVNVHRPYNSVSTTVLHCDGSYSQTDDILMIRSRISPFKWQENHRS